LSDTTHQNVRTIYGVTDFRAPGDSASIQSCLPGISAASCVNTHADPRVLERFSVRYPFARAASSVAASMVVKVAVSILSIKGPVNRPIGPPRGT
jgi:hypothetical protein